MPLLSRLWGFPQHILAHPPIQTRLLQQLLQPRNCPVGHS